LNGVLQYVQHNKCFTNILLTCAANCKTISVFDEWEVPRENVKILEEVGHGSFGSVYRGILHKDNEPECVVAIKVIIFCIMPFVCD